MSEKVSFLLRISTEHKNLYRELHAEIWPEMLEALHESGYRNYSMFLDESGLLVGYLETDDYEASARSMAQHPVQKRWNELMDPLFEPVDEARPVGMVSPLEHVFDLDSQRSRLNRGSHE